MYEAKHAGRAASSSSAAISTSGSPTAASSATTCGSRSSAASSSSGTGRSRRSTPAGSRASRAACGGITRPAGCSSPRRSSRSRYATGVIEQIDEWVLTTAATDMSSWRRDHPDLVAWITVSARLLHARQRRARASCRSSTRRAPTRAASGSRWGRSRCVHDFADTVAALRELHEGNVCVALDNFCGQLTVPQLHTLRPDTVKLDRSFLTQLGADVESATAIRSITGMIRPLGVTVVAKGVNSREQLAARHLAQLRRRAGSDHRSAGAGRRRRVRRGSQLSPSEPRAGGVSDGGAGGDQLGDEVVLLLEPGLLDLEVLRAGPAPCAGRPAPAPATRAPGRAGARSVAARPRPAAAPELPAAAGPAPHGAEHFGFERGTMSCSLRAAITGSASTGSGSDGGLGFPEIDLGFDLDVRRPRASTSTVLGARARLSTSTSTALGLCDLGFERRRSRRSSTPRPRARRSRAPRARAAPRR